MVNMEIVYALLGILSLLVIDFIFGVSISIKNGTFALGRLPNTLKANVLPYVVPLIAMGVLPMLSGATPFQAVEGFFFAFTVAYSAKLMIDIGLKVKDLYGLTV